MVNNAESFTFEYVQELLDYHNVSKVHGLLCGLLCVNGALSSETWLNCVVDELPEDISLTQDSRQLLLALQEATFSQLTADSFSFSLLLPSDQRPLAQRTLSLGYWCQGFLSGLGLGGMQKSWTLSAEADEFLNDLLQIAQVGFDTQNAAEEDECAYTEIIEYVRMGVLLMEQELRPYTDKSRLH
jgi:yecA family protein